jgi:MscS family membrane protein
MMLSMTRPFVIGDLLLLPERDVEGVVEEIGWSFTSIRDKDRRLVYFPNTLFSQLLVINLSKRTGRRILEVFHLRFSDFAKLSPILAKIKNFLESFSRIDKNFPILVFISDIGVYSIDFSLDVYTDAKSLSDYVTVKQAVLEKIFQIVLEQDAQFAYPVSLKNSPEDVPQK